MDPEDVGWGGTELPLTKHSGRHAMVARLEHLGFKLSSDQVATVFERFKDLGDKKKFVYDDDLAALVEDSMSVGMETYILEYIHVTSGSTTIPTATVRLKKGAETLQDSSPGNGAVDAAMQAVDRIVNQRGHLVQYTVEAVTQGRDSLGEVTLKVDFGNGELITGKGASTDVIEASARAYINAVNRAELLRDRKQASVLAPI
jgi:2-isopropylmalate synthase